MFVVGPSSGSRRSELASLRAHERALRDSHGRPRGCEARQAAQRSRIVRRRGHRARAPTCSRSTPNRPSERCSRKIPWISERARVTRTVARHGAHRGHRARSYSRRWYRLVQARICCGARGRTMPFKDATNLVIPSDLAGVYRRLARELRRARSVEMDSSNACQDRAPGSGSRLRPRWPLRSKVYPARRGSRRRRLATSDANGGASDGVTPRARQILGYRGVRSS